MKHIYPVNPEPIQTRVNPGFLNFNGSMCTLWKESKAWKLMAIRNMMKNTEDDLSGLFWVS